MDVRNRAIFPLYIGQIFVNSFYKAAIVKLFFGLLTAMFCAFTVKAQQNNESKNKPLEEYKEKKMFYDTLKRVTPPMNGSRLIIPFLQRKYQNDKSVLKFPLKGNYLGTNDKGDHIYAMYPDNMPCLVPGKSFKSNMPIADNDKRGKFYRSPLRKLPHGKSDDEAENNR